MPALTPELIAQHAPLAALDSRYVDIEAMPWRDTRWPTIKSKVLMEDKERGLATILMHWGPGSGRVAISAKTGAGLDDLRREIATALNGRPSSRVPAEDERSRAAC